MKMIDLRSDTVTQPTARMRERMYQAAVGDDVYQDDPTVRALEELAAQTVGKEAALFVPSGTMGNQLAIMTHTKRGEELIAHEASHIIFHEAGAIALLSSVNTAQVHNDTGFVYASDIRTKVRGNNIHYPRTSLVCIENAAGNGRVIGLKDMKETWETAKQFGLQVHLDGARVFNAATALRVDAREITQYCDSVMFCLSKGLCAPIGSILAGTKEFVDEARRNRKKLGGGMRQAGFLAAAGIEAIEVMTKRLQDDHDNALYLAQLLSRDPRFIVDLASVQINMVYFTIQAIFDEDEMIAFMNGKGIKINGSENGQYRFVTHYWVTREDVEYVIRCLKEFFA